MCDCAHISILFRNQWFLVVWIVDQCEFHVNQIFSFQLFLRHGAQNGWIGFWQFGDFGCRWLRWYPEAGQFLFLAIGHIWNCRCTRTGSAACFHEMANKHISINSNFRQQIDGSQLTYLRANRRWCDDVFFCVNEFQQFLLFCQRISFSCFIVFDSLLAFKFFQLLCIFSFLCDDVLQNCFFVEQKSIFSVEWKENTIDENTLKINEIELNLRYNWVSAWLQRKRTTIETFHWIFANALMVRAISRFVRISFLLMVRVHCSGRAISCVTCHCSNFNSNFNYFDELRRFYLIYIFY